MTRECNNCYWSKVVFDVDSDGRVLGQYMICDYVYSILYKQAVCPCYSCSSFTPKTGYNRD